MSATMLLYPVFVQVALTFALLVWTGRARVGALTAGEVKVDDISVGQKAWPTRVMQISNAYQNQFELPMLFYVLVAFCLIHPRLIDIVMVALAWAFVATRIVHAGIYTTHNAIRWRFNVFVLGFAILAAMWIVFAMRVSG
jgi:hypothetical protein